MTEDKNVMLPSSASNENYSEFVNDLRSVIGQEAVDCCAGRPKLFLVCRQRLTNHWIVHQVQDEALAVLMLGDNLWTTQ